MNREKALALVKEQITERRYIHTLGVVESAIELAERYGADVKKRNLQPFSMIMQNFVLKKKWSK